jgi:hypothetical protein
MLVHAPVISQTEGEVSILWYEFKDSGAGYPVTGDLVCQNNNRENDLPPEVAKYLFRAYREFGSLCPRQRCFSILAGFEDLDVGDQAAVVSPASPTFDKGRVVDLPAQSAVSGVVAQVL